MLHNVACDEGAFVELDGVKIFTATKAREREELGGVITAWISENRSTIEIMDKVVSQSSDSEYHCLTVSLFYKYRKE